MSSAKNQKKQSAFMRWYTSYSGKNAVNVVYSVGASVVIVGALFKIMHWPGAGIVLTAGMMTEAFLFIIGVLEHPHEEYHWGNVFPQLLEYGTEQARLNAAETQEKPTLLGAGVASSPKSIANANAQTVDSKVALSENDYAKIKESLIALAQTAGQLQDLSGVVGASSKLKDKMEKACESADQFLSSQSSLKEANTAYIQQLQTISTTLGKNNEAINSSYEAVVGEMQSVVKGTQNYNQQINNTEKNISALNAVYELQIKTIEQQVEDVKKQSANLASVSQIMSGVVGDMNKMKDFMGKSLQNHDSYLQQTETLNKQLSELNKVYGNMLNALS